ncbi:RrF2 family transcriptional regulator [Pontivivens ytuae]|uniref:Rrf2 family transcriptional regulator n=1 Tax=Pontivivens ytuae TaxID=2789856 RepID=A0A7S9LSF4_9RHOB|nr:Rrf2 family transcriptional regulator [Pontivivens ytuae]QPH54449.1 Rrf2 family transcriptional regulator [Pontivivens ytuae]
MKRNGKLSLALHALGHMARAGDGPLRSEDLAAHHQTNPVVVRRVLGVLRDAGIVSSERGHAGGWRLARAAEEVSVAEVYALLRERTFAADPEAATSPCAIEARLHGVMAEAATAAEDRLRERLATVSIADLACAMDGAAGEAAPGLP